MTVTLPAEILCEILHLLHDKPISIHVLDNRSCFTEFPWAVGQVCRHWRGSFLSYPFLWSSLSLQSGFFTAASFAEMNRRTALYLERSEQLPLTITVSMSDSSIRTFPTATFRLLLSHSNRWKKADLVLRNESVIVDLVRCLDKVPILESLGISVDGFLAEKYYNAFAIAPQLTELDISHRGGIRRWTLPWSQVTKLRIDVSFWDFVYTAQLDAILSQLQNVEELRFIVYLDPSCTLSKRPVSIRLPRVQFLEISLCCSPIFSWFELPLLEHLWVDDCVDFMEAHDTCSEEILSLVRRSSCHIRRLTLQDCKHELALIIMKVLNSVEELCIKDPLLDIGLVIGFMANPSVDDVYYLPNLRRLQVICCPGTADRDFMDAIGRLLELRGKESVLAFMGFTPIERVMIQITQDDCQGICCRGKSNVGVVDVALEMMRGCLSIADVYIDGESIGRPGDLA